VEDSEKDLVCIDPDKKGLMENFYLDQLHGSTHSSKDDDAAAWEHMKDCKYHDKQFKTLKDY
jgi:hypothetical protein